MNRCLWNSLVLVAACSLGPLAGAADRAPCGVTAQETADGEVRLSNADDTSACRDQDAVAKADPDAMRARTSADAGGPADAVPATEPPVDAAQTPAAAVDSGDATADAAPDPAAAKDPLMLHRDAMLAGGEGNPRATPARSRRYRMMDKATYQATVAGASAGAGQAATGGANAP